MLKLGNVPDMSQADFWDHGGGRNESVHYVLWPANVGSILVTVRIPASALNVGIDTGNAKAALERHRGLIERRAQERYRPGDEVVTLQVADLSAS
jgi:hypothetical protein